MANSKKLLVMRHAKSSWTDAGIPDHDRPLNRRGKRDAVQMAQFLISQDIPIDRIAASTAVRADQTAKSIVKTVGHLRANQHESRAEFYLAAPRIYMTYLRSVDESISTLMMIGHNPGLESLVQNLHGRWENMPTAAIACFDLAAASWNKADPAMFRLDDVWRPKDILEHYR